MKRSTLGRAVVAAVLFLTLGGPAPGAVGSCGSESTAADAVAFCEARKTCECDRARARGDALPPASMAFCTDAGEADPAICNWLYCRNIVEAQCAPMAWACDSPPTTAVTTPCINALCDATRVTTPTPDITECHAEVLCPAAGALTEALEETDVGASPESPVQAEGI